MKEGIMAKKRTYEAIAARTCGSWTMQVRGVDDLLVQAVMLEYARADMRTALADRLGVSPDSVELAVSVEETLTPGD
jgi:hypothetical protein